ncbi:MAG TPA: hypothetical protein VGU63_13215 [Candidatus Acidoferrales bacterium]|nr:hypothetical protein [Candidatus Acidoferrales bacterium]
MKQIAARSLLAIILLLPASGAAAQTPRQPHLGRETWYDVMFKKLNRSHNNYGSWLEERRQALADASVRNPFFWYSFWMTVCASLLALALLKHVVDSRQSDREHARIEADIRSHDLHSRQKTKEAVDRYNKHIEECNRATEAADSGGGRLGWGNSVAEGVKAELGRVATRLEATTQERNKLQEELRQKSDVVADLSTRLDALSRKANGTREAGGHPKSSVSGGDSARLVAQINRLQDELYAERQKNKRLKGA